MNKTMLLQKFASNADIQLEEATQIVNIVFETLKTSLLEGDRIEIRGFGTFKLKTYKGYIGRNPKTGDRVNVKPKRVPLFKAGKELKNLVNN